MTNQKIKVLVTGGAGYIGSHMVLKLLDAGYEPVVVDNLSSGFKNIIPGVCYHVFDIGSTDEWTLFFKQHKIDLVMHFAASTKVCESVINPFKYYYNNYMNTLFLLEQMRKHKLKHIIFSSTAAIYGEPEYNPVNESHPKNPINPYGKSKWMCELALEDVEVAYGIRSVRLRYFNAAGADPLCRAGFNNLGNTQLIPKLLAIAGGEHEYFDVYGNDYDTSDGTCIRDFIHVVDVCEAHLSATKYLLSGGKSQCYNLGIGRGYSVLEVVSAVEKVTDKNITLNFQARRAGDPGIVVADANKAQQSLGWHPQFTKLNSMVKDAWRWRQKNALMRI